MKLLALAALLAVVAWLLRRALPLDPFDRPKSLPNVEPTIEDWDPSVSGYGW